MTHTLHRQGSVEDLREDYVLLLRTSRFVNHEGSEKTMQQIWEVISHYREDLVNFGNHYPNWDGGELYDLDALQKAKSRIIHVVFKDREKIKACLKEIKERDFGISTVVSGLCGETEKICAEIGIAPHTVNYSLGVHGRTERLPKGETLEIHTMCGHAMVSYHLIDHMIKEIRRGKMTCNAAAKKLSRMCDCGIFNTYRAEKLLQKMTASHSE
jgi:hypothetical protein